MAHVPRHTRCACSHINSVFATVLIARQIVITKTGPEIVNVHASRRRLDMEQPRSVESRTFRLLIQSRFCFDCSEALFGTKKKKTSKDIDVYTRIDCSATQ